MINTNIAGTAVNLPDLGYIPTPKTRAALEHALAIGKAKAQAWQARDHATEAKRDVGNAEAIRNASILEADPFAELPDLGVAYTEAEQAERVAQERLDALVVAEREALARLRAAMNEEADSWAKTVTANAGKALTKLTTATRIADEARTELAATVGVLRMLRLRQQAAEEGGEGLLSVTPKAYGYTFDLDPAVQGLRAAIAGATSELDELKPAKKGKKATTPEVPVAPPAVAEEPAAEALAIVAEQDADDE